MVRYSSRAKKLFFTVAHVSEIIITDLTISLVLTRDNVLRIISGPYVPLPLLGITPKKFDSVHQTFSRREARASGARVANVCHDCKMAT